MKHCPRDWVSMGRADSPWPSKFVDAQLDQTRKMKSIQVFPYQRQSTENVTCTRRARLCLTSGREIAALWRDAQSAAGDR